MTIYWKALEDLVVPLVFRFNHFWRKNVFSEFFSKKPQSSFLVYMYQFQIHTNSHWCLLWLFWGSHNSSWWLTSSINYASLIAAAFYPCGMGQKNEHVHSPCSLSTGQMYRTQEEKVTRYSLLERPISQTKVNSLCGASQWNKGTRNREKRHKRTVYRYVA
jgi:hypothetical protein